jgi:23S rRNA (cytosine1962-C5)-methyltransferase
MKSAFPTLRLKPRADVHLKNGHHAIFRTAIDGTPDVKDGSIVEVQSSTGDFLCYATWNSKAYIAGRAIAWEKGDPMESMKKMIERAVKLREVFFSHEETTAYRLINAEGDFLPGLIADRYADTIVIQLTTLGMDVLRDWVIETVSAVTKCTKVYEKSSGPARKKEGLSDKEGWAKGGGETMIPVFERGLQFLINLSSGQKTGLFLDQREMRSLIRSVARDRTVLDCFSYVGGFSLAALLGGAKTADAVDYDEAALEQAVTISSMNGIDPHRFKTYGDDAFHFLRNPLPRTYDLIILDPPAFAKRSADLEPAKKAYTDINRLAFQKIAPGGLLLTCSCSYQMDPALFQTVVFHAARQAKRSVRILQHHRHAFDHPVNLFHPEGDYLKSLLLAVE